ncbi:MAG: alcohol dehydrogenase catalytic domain-containing protein [Candidatus Krumholzibacteriota bacterium]|nr:alcohol dehydrogenase catalytic domain-containing protein [Candidatus Krumholzibacteriota bacterium]
MRALYFDGKNIEEKRMPRPRPGRGEALIKVRVAGICSTDLEILRGYMGFRGVPGHEFVGTVVSAPRRELEGMRVTGEINIPCHRCSICRRGLEKHCPQRQVLGIRGRHGAFAEYLALPVKNLHPLPPSLSDEEAVFTELLAAAYEIPERLRIPRDSRVAVLGDGRLAALVAQVLYPRAGEFLLFGRGEGKMERLRNIGLPVVNISEKDKYLRSYDIVAECTGVPAGLSLASQLARPQGTIVLKSTFFSASGSNLSAVVVDEQTIHGSRCGPFAEALRALAAKRVQVLPFLTAVYPFHRWRTAVRRARRKDSFKVLLDLRG